MSNPLQYNLYARKSDEKYLGVPPEVKALGEKRIGIADYVTKILVDQVGQSPVLENNVVSGRGSNIVKAPLDAVVEKNIESKTADKPEVDTDPKHDISEQSDDPAVTAARQSVEEAHLRLAA